MWAFEGSLYLCNDSAVVPQDFELNTELKMRVIGFLEEVMHDPELLTQERKAAANIIRLVFCYHGSQSYITHLSAHVSISSASDLSWKSKSATGDTVNQPRSRPDYYNSFIFYLY